MDPAALPVDPSAGWLSQAVLMWMFGVTIGGWYLLTRRYAGQKLRSSSFAISLREREEQPALVIILIAASVCGLVVYAAALTGDEASNLEPNFWTNWYLAWESRSSPPLFRFLIHGLALIAEERVLMRLPSLACGLASLWYLYILLRRRTSAPNAHWMLGMVASSALFVGYATQQKAYTPWLLLLLMVHRCFASAMRGRRTMWARFSVLATLSVLTHYLSVGWLLGYAFWVWQFSRRDVRDVALALLPAALAVLPMLWPILAVNEPVSEGPGVRLLGDWLRDSMSAAFVPGGLIATILLFVPRPMEHVRGTHHGDGALSWAILGGLIAAFGASVGGSLHARFLMPVVPFAALALAGRMPRPTRDWSRNDRAMLVLAALGSLAIGTARIGPMLVAPSMNPVRTALVELEDEPPPSLRLVFPPWALHGALFEASGRRDLLHKPMPDGALRLSAKVDGATWGVLRGKPDTKTFDALVKKHQTVEIWALAGGDGNTDLPPINAWTRGVCHDAVDIGEIRPALPGPWVRVWRCGR